MSHRYLFQHNHWPTSQIPLGEGFSPTVVRDLSECPIIATAMRPHSRLEQYFTLLLCVPYHSNAPMPLSGLTRSKLILNGLLPGVDYLVPATL
jgi:hypothetical protein